MAEDADFFIDNFLIHLRTRNYSENTLQAYGRDLSQWAGFLGEQSADWRRAGQKEVNAFLSSFAAGLENRSRARKIAGLKAFYRYCHHHEILPENPFQAVRAPRYRKSLPKPLRGTDMEILLEDDSSQSEFIQKRDKALWELMYSSGMRISEILSLRLRDLRDEDGEFQEEIRVHGKGGKERVVFAGDAARRALADYAAIARLKFSDWNREGGFFRNNRGGKLGRRGAQFILSRRMQALQLDKKHSPHSLRHSFATDLIDQGADIRHVQEMLGHASISTTQNYVKVAAEKLRRNFWECHPHARKPDGKKD